MIFCRVQLFGPVTGRGIPTGKQPKTRQDKFRRHVVNIIYKRIIIEILYFDIALKYVIGASYSYIDGSRTNNGFDIEI